MNDIRIDPTIEKLTVLLLMLQEPARPFTITDLVDKVHYTPRHVQHILETLIDSELVVQTRTISGDEMGYMAHAMIL